MIEDKLFLRWNDDYNQADEPLEGNTYVQQNIA